MTRATEIADLKDRLCKAYELLEKNHLLSPGMSRWWNKQKPLFLEKKDAVKQSLLRNGKLPPGGDIGNISRFIVGGIGAIDFEPGGRKSPYQFELRWRDYKIPLTLDEAKRLGYRLPTDGWAA